jgi:hybrid cluster-associated redox disulfide protein
MEAVNCSRVNPQLTVADVLRCWQETIPVFLRHRMACLGCPMACFETLESAAAIYGLDLNAFLEELQASVSGPTREDSRGVNLYPDIPSGLEHP